MTPPPPCHVVPIHAHHRVVYSHAASIVALGSAARLRAYVSRRVRPLPLCGLSASELDVAPFDAVGGVLPPFSAPGVDSLDIPSVETADDQGGDTWSQDVDWDVAYGPYGPAPFGPFPFPFPPGGGPRPMRPTPVSGAPEPATWAQFALAVAIAGMSLRLRRLA